MKRAIARVVSNKVIGSGLPEAHLLSIKSPYLAAEARPGQFVMVKCGDNVMLRRPLGIHSVEQTDIINLLFVKRKVAGDLLYGSSYGEGTEWLSAQKKGSKLDIIGPLGNGFTLNPHSKNILLIAGGMGIVPLVFLSRIALEKGLSVTMMIGARNANQLYLDGISEKVQLELIIEEGDMQANYIFRRGMITADRQFLLSRTAIADQVFICGPKPMYEALDKEFDEMKQSKDIQVSLEVRMGCGIGTCYGCSIKMKSGMKKVCTDGPVFSMSEIIWEEVKV